MELLEFELDAVAVIVSAFDVVIVCPFPPVIVAVIVYVFGVRSETVYCTFVKEFAPAVPLAKPEASVAVMPDGLLATLTLYVVAVLPALFMPTVKVVELPFVMLVDESEEDAVRLAGVSTVRPVCELAERLPPVPESVAETLTVIWFE